MAFGGYTTAILTHNHGWNDLATLPVAALVGFAAGIVVGLPALRLHGVYLALTTFAVALAVPQIAKNYPNFTGGTEGLALPTHTRPLALPRRRGSSRAIIFVLAWLLLRGRTGRAFRAGPRQRDRGRLVGGDASPSTRRSPSGSRPRSPPSPGSLYVLVNNFVNPDVFGLTLSLYILIGAVVGGLGSLWGVLVGAALRRAAPDRPNHHPHQFVAIGTGDLRSRRHRSHGPASRWARPTCCGALAFRIQDRSKFRRSPRHGGQMTRRMKGALALAVLVLARSSSRRRSPRPPRPPVSPARRSRSAGRSR